MHRPFLFMSGEHRVTMLAAFTNSRWEHTSSSQRLLIDTLEGHVVCESRPYEKLKGTISYADMDDKRQEVSNYDVLISSGLPTWPPAAVLKANIDRHANLTSLDFSHYVEHDVYVRRWKSSGPTFQDMTSAKHVVNDIKELFDPNVARPIVLKVGNKHRGEGKYKLYDASLVPTLLIENEGFTVEPFFRGLSVRVLVIGEETFGMRVENETSWIKNTSGAETFEFELDERIKQHARDVTKECGLEIAGVDYVVNDDGFNFLECNMFPGFTGWNDDVLDLAKKFFVTKMRNVEEQNA